ncbi:MAG TPA: apolipoprotein N-acyltransferase [Candidatus Polarisedimenticolia bacterium]|nr:apolipoprotein N-acyltransferase [Candidatus Polarisedimenticolia bacterium]
MVLSRGRRFLLSACSGVLIGISFPGDPSLPGFLQEGIGPAAWFCLCPLLLAAAAARSAREAAVCGLLAGGIGYGAVLYWMAPFLIRWGRLSMTESVAVTALLVAYVAIYVAGFSACVRVWSARWGAPAALLLAAPAWTALEYLRATALTGFPWCPLGVSQYRHLTIIQVADLAGVFGVSFVLVASSALAALLARRLGGERFSRMGRATGWTLVLLIAATLAYGWARLMREPSAGETLRVALVQANVPQEDRWEATERDEIEAIHVEMTRNAAGAGAQLVVWSESSVPVSMTTHPEFGRRLESLASEAGADMVVGSVAYETRSGRRVPRNSAYLVRPDTGLAGRYDKIHLVPFGEYVPLHSLLFFLEPLVHEAGDFEPGESVTVLEGRHASLGVLICYEATFPELTRRWVAAGATLLVNMTNDSWYADTAMPRQHLAQSILRAVESRRFLLRCAATGISAIISPSGRITGGAAYGERSLVLGDAAVSRIITPYAWMGDAVSIMCVILTALSLLLALRADPLGGTDAL